MLSDLRKSLNSVLYERSVSPLSGTFFISWLVWNWQIPYILFWNHDADATYNIEFVATNLIHFKRLFLYPAISTICLISAYPFLSNQAYKVWHYFTMKRNEIKNALEKNQLLTLDQSIEIKLDIQKQKDEFNSVIKSKDEEINILKAKLEKIEASMSTPMAATTTTTTLESQTSEDKYRNSFETFKKSRFYSHFGSLIKAITQEDFAIFTGPPEVVAYCLSSHIIEENVHKYKFTDKGDAFVRFYLEDKHVV